MAIDKLKIIDTPVAILDFETTGLTAGYDRVVEAAVVRIDPGEEPKLVFNTLINPSRPMAATYIHGITDADVASAPRFRDIAGELLAHTKDCVLAAYNVYFDMSFLRFELANCGVDHQPPHICLMYMRPLLDLGKRCTLGEACEKSGIDHDVVHIASTDALASSRLFSFYLGELKRRGIDTYEDLAALKNYKFTQSFSCLPFPDPAVFRLERAQTLLPRIRRGSSVPFSCDVAAYWDNLKTVLADGTITQEELNFLRKENGGLRQEYVRAVHARFLMSALTAFTRDLHVDEEENSRLRDLYSCLSQLGWAPGQ